MGRTDAQQSRALERLHELVRRVNSQSADLTEVLGAIARGVAEEFGYGAVAISQVSGDEFVVTSFAGDERAGAEVLGLRMPIAMLDRDFAAAEDWGILRFMPHTRVRDDDPGEGWIPDLATETEPGDWHPMDSLYAPLYSATGELLGMMSVDLPPDNKIPDVAQREMLEMFAVQAGLAMSNAQQRAVMRERVRLSETVKLVAGAGSILSPEKMLADSAAAVASGLGATEILIRGFERVDDEGLTVQWPPLPRRPVPGLPELRRTVEELAKEGGGAIVVGPSTPETSADDDPHDSARIRALLEVGDDADLVVVPLLSGQQAVGCLVINWSPYDHQPSAEEVAAIGEIGRELGRKLQQSRLYESERQVVAELRELDRYRTELIATVSHELRTPLTSIIGHAELLEDEGPRVMQTSVAAISRNAERLNVLIRSLLDYSRVQEPTMLSSREADLVGVVRSSVDRFAMPAQQADLTVEARYAAARVPVYGDADELALVVDNLIGNAIKYTPGEGRIRVEVAVRGGHAQVICADNGMGIAANDLDQVFSAFNRSSNPAAQSIPGTGLGLAISRRIAELHGGEIAVESHLGEGSTFRLTLPLASGSHEFRDAAATA